MRAKIKFFLTDSSKSSGLGLTSFFVRSISFTFSLIITFVFLSTLASEEEKDSDTNIVSDEEPVKEVSGKKLKIYGQDYSFSVSQKVIGEDVFFRFLIRNNVGV